MAGKHTNQERPEQKRSQSGMNQGNRPFPGGTRDQGDPSRDSRSRESSRDSQTGERHPGTSERSGSQSSQRATHGQDMTRGSSGKVNESKRPDDKESEDVDRDKRRSSSERERKESH